jgi:hypothetical protein
VVLYPVYKKISVSSCRYTGILKYFDVVKMPGFRASSRRNFAFSSQQTTEMASPKHEPLNQYLTKSGCYCLNEDTRHPHGNLFIGDHTLDLRSDADEQLLLQLSFQQTVLLRKLEIGVPADNSCPMHVKLFANKLNLGFSDATGKLFIYFL